MKTLIFTLILSIGLTFTSFAQTGSPSDLSQPASKIVKVYPNPATTVVNVEFTKNVSRNYSLRILNSLGKQVYASAVLPSFFSIDLRDGKFYRGIYIYQVINRAGNVVQSEKILVVN